MIICIGWCDKCNAWKQLDNGGSYFLPHKCGEKDCPNKGRSAAYTKYPWRYLLENDVDAAKMAERIKKDNGDCLKSDRHSMMCGDGKNCNDEHNRRALSIARWVLKKLTP
jgi:hypothetical protein